MHYAASGTCWIMKYRYYISDSVDPYRNLAMEQALFQCVREDIAILFLWQNDRTIVVGKNQDISAECRLDDFLRYGGRPARRRSGGGAVYHDLGNLNYSVICQEKEREACGYYDLICGTVGKYGLKAEFNGRNDITVNNRKISGNAEYTSGGISCRHGTLLIHTDIAVMERFLTPRAGKLARSRVQSVGARVADLSEFIPGISVRAITGDIIEFCHAEALEDWGAGEDVEKLELFFGSAEWIYGGLE